MCYPSNRKRRVDQHVRDASHDVTGVTTPGDARGRGRIDI